MTRPRPSVLILHNEPYADGAAPAGTCSESVTGVLAQVAAVAAALDQLHMPHRTVSVRAFQECPAVLAAAPEMIVLNLVEGFALGAESAGFVPALCTAFGKECTGADAACLGLTLDKVHTKAVLASADLPVPAGVLIQPGSPLDPMRLPPPPWIVKPARTDASEGITGEGSIILQAGDALLRAVEAVHRDFGQAALVEQLVGERELNVSVVERAGCIEVLPLAEIDFSAFPAGKPRIVDYAAKWLPDSFEFSHTPRIIPAPLPPKTAESIRNASRRAWQALGCRDYARVDIRLSANGDFHVLEVNANPDISPDAGFAAALTAAGIDFAEFVAGIVDNTCVRLESQRASSAPSTSERGRQAESGKQERSREATLAPDIRTTAAADRDAIVQLVRATGFFREEEIGVACEVLDDALRDGPAGHYQSLCATLDGRPVGWVCYGPTPCTVGTFDVYWLAVDPACQGHGLGRALMCAAEDGMRARNAALVVVETSGSDHYDGTRRFYLRQGYLEVARVPDFYAPGDDRVMYTKRLETA